MTPEAEARLLHRTAERGVWFAVHAGSTEHGSNIEGMREIIELADGTPFHLCHINAYCRGSVRPIEEEIAEATALLESHPEIDTESYLSPVNGCSGKCVNGVPESRVTCNCLKSGGYSVDANGVRSALLAGYAQAQKTVSSCSQTEMKASPSGKRTSRTSPSVSTSTLPYRAFILPLENAPKNTSLLTASARTAAAFLAMSSLKTVSHS